MLALQAIAGVAMLENVAGIPGTFGCEQGSLQSRRNPVPTGMRT